MNIVRVALLFFAGSLQRRFLLVALMLMVVGHAMTYPAFRTHSRVFVLIDNSRQLLFWIVLAFALSNASVIFRRALALREVSLLRASRMKLLLGAILAQLIVAVCIAGNAALLMYSRSGAVDWTHFQWVFLTAFSLAILWMICVFALSSPVWGGRLLLPILVVGGAVGLAQQSLSFIIPWIAAIALIAFSAWLAKTIRIASPSASWDRQSRGGLSSVAMSTHDRSVSATKLVKLHLLGTDSAIGATFRTSALLLAFNIFFLVSVTTNQRNYKMSIDLGNGPLIFALVICVAQIILTRAMVAQTRFLWLSVGKSRNEIFEICEGLAWQCLAAISLPFLALSIVEFMVLPHSKLRLPEFLFLAAAPAVASLYAGMLNVRGKWRLDDVAIAIAIVGGSALGAFAMRQIPVVGAELQLAMGAVVFIAAPLLRQTARRRWRTVDWRELQPHLT